MSNIPAFYLLRPFTNLQAGGSDAGLGVIDNYIQRDPATAVPCIHGSSLKGAIKQSLDGSGMSSALMTEIFGSDSTINKKGGSKNFNQGGSAFLSAHLLLLATPCDRTPFVLATCPGILKAYVGQRGDLKAVTKPEDKTLLETVLNANFGKKKGTLPQRSFGWICLAWL